MKNIIIISLVFLSSISLSKAEMNPDSSDTGFVKEKISISGIEKGLIDKEILLSSKGLVFQDSTAKLFKIVGFKLSLFIKNKDLIELDTYSGEISDEMKSAIKSAPSGSKLFFEYIRCVDNTGKNTAVLPTQFTLK